MVKMSKVPNQISEKVKEIQSQLDNLNDEANKIENIISKSEWNEYVKVQMKGWFNMFDARARQLTSLSREKWLVIMENYDYLDKHYKKKGGRK